MKTYPISIPIYGIKVRQKKINPKPQYQRGPVWSPDKKQLLIDTIIRGYDIPKFYLRKTGGDFEHEVVDGQQRLRAIWEFCDNKYVLGSYSDDIPEEGDLSGRYFKDLSSEQQEKILAFTLTVTQIDDATENEIRELFLRLQSGESLNPAEKRNAMIGNMRDFVSELANHKAFLKTNINNRRFEYDDWAAHITCLELASGPTNLKAADLKKMYEDEASFEYNGRVARKIKKVLNYMDKVLNEYVPEMNIKWGFVDLYLLISKLIDEYVITKRHQDFLAFYLSFEKERRSITDPAELISNNGMEWNRDLYDYIEAFQREGAVRRNIETRHKVYLRTFLKDFPDLVAKDTTRLFNEDERIVIWRRAGGRCENPECGVSVDYNDMHADHIVLHSRGGKTTIENGQCLCGPCNLVKNN